MNVYFLILTYQLINTKVMKNSASAVVTAIVTSIMVFYNILLHTSGPTDLVLIIFCLSPLLMIWLVMTILKDIYRGRELAPGEHWGYQDRNNDDLNVF